MSVGNNMYVGRLAGSQPDGFAEHRHIFLIHFLALRQPVIHSGDLKRVGFPHLLHGKCIIFSCSGLRFRACHLHAAILGPRTFQDIRGPGLAVGRQCVFDKHIEPDISRFPGRNCSQHVKDF